MARGWATAGLLALMTTGCAGVDYAGLSPGKFSGSLFVMWVDDSDPNGQGRFLFVPDPSAPLIFTRPSAGGAGREIQPAMMYTDGGSIPRIAQAFKGFSPWTYAPAYMIHDWLFVARHCLRDGQATPEMAKLKDIDFPASAAIAGEAIKGLIASRRVQENDVAPAAITWAVGSVFAEQKWNLDGACAVERISDRDRAAALAAIPGAAGRAQLRLMAPGVARRATPARIVAQLSF